MGEVYLSTRIVFGTFLGQWENPPVLSDINPSLATLKRIILEQILEQRGMPGSDKNSAFLISLEFVFLDYKLYDCHHTIQSSILLEKIPTGMTVG